VAEMHLIYVKDTVDEVIYEREDWSDLTGEANNVYLEWPLGADVPISRDRPPRWPCMTEEQAWERLHGMVGDKPQAWDGCMPEDVCAVDTNGNVRNDRGTVIANPQGVLRMMEKVRGPGAAGRFGVTREHRFVVVSHREGDKSALYVAGLLVEPFVPAEEKEVACPDVSALPAG